MDITIRAQQQQRRSCVECISGFASGEFSPSGNMFYLTYRPAPGDQPNQLYQFALNNMDTNQTAVSRQLIRQGCPPVSFDQCIIGLQLAPSGEVVSLLPSVPDAWLSVVKNPNALGAACGFTVHGIQSSQMGVPAGNGSNIINSMLLDTVPEIRHVGGCGTGTDTVQLWLANPG
jgi:hypothetical protein